MKPLILEMDAWSALSTQLHNDYPKSVLAIRSKSKSVLGFTTRIHHTWVPNADYDSECASFKQSLSDLMLLNIDPKKGSMKRFIHLDFYDEMKRTFFILKYSDYLKCEK